MLRAGYGYARHSAIEAAVEAYDGPKVTSDGSIEPWIAFSLDCFYHQKMALESALAARETRQPLSPLAEAVMAVAHARGRITLKGAVEATRGNRNTLKVHFKNLVDNGHLVPHGKGRATWYAPSTLVAAQLP
jgi:hypothetical protein